MLMGVLTLLVYEHTFWRTYLDPIHTLIPLSFVRMGEGSQYGSRHSGQFGTRLLHDQDIDESL